jgi:putative transposase
LNRLWQACASSVVCDCGAISACSEGLSEATPLESKIKKHISRSENSRHRIMPNTYTSLHYHIIFSTKNREPWIDREWRYRLWEYLGGTVRNLGGHSHETGGVADHVHLLVSLKPTQMISKVMQEVKKSSSMWVHDELRISGFAWQDGYAAFTVSASVLPKVLSYVQNQEEHHRTRTFREELEELLTKSGVVFDPKYLD